MMNIKSLRYPFVLLVLVGLMIADGVLTEFFVGFGLAREGSPFMMLSLNKGNFMLFKFLGAVLCALILWDVYKRHQRAALITSALGIILYTGIVYWNIVCVFLSGKFLH